MNLNVAAGAGKLPLQAALAYVSFNSFILYLLANELFELASPINH